MQRHDRALASLWPSKSHHSHSRRMQRSHTNSTAGRFALRRSELCSPPLQLPLCAHDGTEFVRVPEATHRQVAVPIHRPPRRGGSGESKADAEQHRGGKHHLHRLHFELLWEWVGRKPRSVCRTGKIQHGDCSGSIRYADWSMPIAQHHPEFFCANKKGLREEPFVCRRIVSSASVPCSNCSGHDGVIAVDFHGVQDSGSFMVPIATAANAGRCARPATFFGTGPKTRS